MDNTVSGGQEVTLQLNVKTGDGQKAMKDLAAGTREAGAAAKGTQREFDALAEAQKRFAAQDRERAVRAHMERLQPSPGPGFAMRAAPVLGLGYAAGRVISAAGAAATGIGSLAAQRAATTGGSVSASEASALFAKNLAEGIPILGGFIKSIGDAGYALSGITQQAQMAQAGLTVIGRQLAAQRAESAGRAQLAGTLYGGNIHAADAQAQAMASADYAAGLTPGRLAGYRGAFGGALEGVDQAASQVKAAKEQLWRREQEHLTTKWQTDDLRAGSKDATRNADELQANADAWQNRLGKLRQGFLGGRFENPGGIESKAATNATDRAQAAQMLAQEKSKQLGEQLALGQRQIADIEQKRVELAQAELTHQRAILAVKQQVAQGAEGRANVYGVSSPGRAMQDEQSLRMIQQQGWENVSPAMRQRALAIPGAAEILGQRMRDFGDKQGAGVRDALADMAPAGQRDQIRKPLADQQDEIRKLQAQQGAEAAQKQATAAKNFAAELAAAVTEVFDLTVSEFKRELKMQVQQQILLNKGN